jgi:hypothetical protein
MPYRQVIRAKKLGGQIAGHARQHAQRVATSATALFPDLLRPGQQYLDLHQFQVAVGQELEKLHGELIEIDNRHAHQLEVARQLRGERGDLDGQVRTAMLKLKRTAEGSFGAGASRIIFEEDPPRLPNDSTALHQVAERAFEILTDPEFPLDSDQPGVVVNPAVVAQGFAAPLAGLGTTLKALHDAESAIRGTQSQKDEQLLKLETFNGNVARFYEALYVLAGEERLARRLRRSSHVPPPSGEPGDDEPGSGPAPAADAEAAADDLEASSPADAEEETFEEADA